MLFLRVFWLYVHTMSSYHNSTAFYKKLTCIDLGCSSDEDEKNMTFCVINLYKIYSVLTYFNSNFYSYWSSYIYTLVTLLVFRWRLF